MRARLPLLALALSALAAQATAQDGAPPVKRPEAEAAAPDAESRKPAPRPAAPATAGAASPRETVMKGDAETQGTPAPGAAPQTQARPGSQGRIIPPEEMLPLAKQAAPPDAAEVTAGSEPPAPETLRESALGFALCRLQLAAMGTRYRLADPVTELEERDCGIARPIEVSEIIPGVTLDGGALMRCGTALALASWTRDFVRPAARRLSGAPELTGMTLGTTYQCRAVVGGPSTSRLSEHAVGNAIDIASFRLSDGQEIAIAPRADSGDMQMAFQAAVQAAACVDFTTVLGPGSNAAHDDHLHLDIKARRGGWRLCQ